ncbi:MAG: hypothetical protein JW795_16545 [Chitinivibrionales bacterium]|nr:hypothetical protein [Chitinivibrionales bacterium]
MTIFEALMLICFGISWPISIVKALRTKVVAGKSPAFMMIICLGYLCGIANKMLTSFDWVTFLYVINLGLVTIDIILYYRFIDYLPPQSNSDSQPSYLKRAESSTSFDTKLKNFFDKLKQEVLFRL